MSTFNGEKYVIDQLNSILRQLPHEGRILIRDDGSTDKTKIIIQDFNDPRIDLIAGDNVGFAGSFLKLIEIAPSNYDIYMLSDQDDIWLPDKIQRAISSLLPYLEIPALYCTRMQLVDENLNYLGLSPLWPNLPSFSNALTENIVTGCTSAITQPLKYLVAIHIDMEKIFFHDWWLYLIGSAFGKVIYDPNLTIKYRQHQNNVIGMRYGINRYFSIIKFIYKTSWIKIMENQLAVFQVNHYYTLDENQKVQLSKLLNTNGKLRRAKIIFSTARHRQYIIGEIMLRLLIMLDHRKSISSKL